MCYKEEQLRIIGNSKPNEDLSGIIGNQTNDRLRLFKQTDNTQSKFYLGLGQIAANLNIHSKTHRNRLYLYQCFHISLFFQYISL